MIDHVHVGRLVMLIVGAGIVSSPSSHAQMRFQPFINVTAAHESDVFSTPDDRRSDLVTRVTPGMATTYESPLLRVSARYALDAERFLRYPELTSMDARQQGILAFSYRPTPRTAMTASGEWLATRTPRDLNVLTGLTAGRAAARRVAANGSVIRQFSPVMFGEVSGIVTRDRLGSAFTAATYGAAASLGRRLSRRTDLRGGYRVDAFVFDSAGARNHVNSHAVGMGVTHAWSPRLSVSIDAGPRMIGSRVRPEVATTVTCECVMDLAFSYARTHTTVIGLPGAAAVERLGLTIGRTVGGAFEVQLAPAVMRSTLAARRATVHTLDINVRRSLTAHVSLDITLQGSLQRGSLQPRGSRQSLPRHAVVMRLVMAGLDPHPAR